MICIVWIGRRVETAKIRLLVLESMEISDFQKTILRRASEAKGRGGFSASSCHRHILRAIQLAKEMPEISAFLAITAEEEAASSIFYALEKRRYDKWTLIKKREHKYKAAVYPVIRLIGDVMAPQDDALNVNLYFGTPTQVNENGLLRVGIPITTENGKQLQIVPEPPFGFQSKGLGGEFRDFGEEIKKIASEYGIGSVHDYVRDLANERNKMLYASDKAIPSVANVDKFLERHISAAITNLAVFLLIEPHKKQHLVQEGLYAYLKVLRKLDV